MSIETPHVYRLKQEHYDLSVKVTALDNYVSHSMSFASLAKTEQKMMVEQLAIMRKYQSILSDRLEFIASQS